MDMVKRILLGDTNLEYRSALAEHISSNEADMQVVGQTGDGAELVRMVRESEPDAVVMEMVLTSLDGLEVLSELGKLEHPPKVMILSSYNQSGMVEEASALSLIHI